MKAMKTKMMDVFSYNSSTGDIRSKGRSRVCKPNSSGYKVITFEGVSYLAHRVAWFLYYKKDPIGHQIDHINADKNDNRVSNLRLVDNKTNCRNQRRPSNNTSGFTGVNWHKQHCMWHAKVKYNYKTIHCGYFDNIEEAVQARLLKLKELNYDKNHGA